MNQIFRVIIEMITFGTATTTTIAAVGYCISTFDSKYSDEARVSFYKNTFIYAAISTYLWLFVYCISAY